MERTCRYCPAVLTTPNLRVTRCSALGCKKAWKRDYMRQYQRDWAAKHGEWANAKHRPRKSNASCANCGAPVKHGATAETKCRQCHHLPVPRLVLAQRRLDRAAEGTSGAGRWTAGHCWRCGTAFLGRLGRHCSVRCRRADARDVRRALERGCKVTPGRRYAIYERDSWTCQLCGGLVDRPAKVPERLAPVIDHIVPLARGGAHAPENWQTAHFYCNSVKRDQLDFDFVEVVAA